MKSTDIATRGGGRAPLPRVPVPIDGTCHCRTPQPVLLVLWGTHECRRCRRWVPVLAGGER